MYRSSTARSRAQAAPAPVAPPDQTKGRPATQHPQINSRLKHTPIGVLGPLKGLYWGPLVGPSAGVGIEVIVSRASSRPEQAGGEAKEHTPPHSRKVQGAGGQGQVRSGRSKAYKGMSASPRQQRCARQQQRERRMNTAADNAWATAATECALHCKNTRLRVRVLSISCFM